ncbi:MAG: tetratricopeptide repeat protein [Candidatus Baltobacteraceae bacterium]
MREPFGRPRRWIVVLTALVLALLFFHAALARSLVVRGDDFLYRSDRAQAIAHYKRALLFDGGSEDASDRLIFAALMERTPATLREGVREADRFLRRHPASVTVRADRALCYLITRRYDRAYADFERVAAQTHQARDYAFAGWAAAHAGDRRAARALWERALQIEPHFAPAVNALSRRS